MRAIAAWGAAAGWAALVGIFGYHTALQLLVGTRVSGTTDRASIDAYYSHSVVPMSVIEQFLVLGLVLVFALALRTCIDGTDRTRFLATLGLCFAIAEVPVILTELSAQAALVVMVRAGADSVGLFRFWDVLYNSGTYALEAGLLASFGLAMRDDRAFPRWVPTAALVGAALQIVNMTAIWVGIPDAATMIGNLAFALFFAGGSVGLRRLARTPQRVGTRVATA